jgi:hypothetical protein
LERHERGGRRKKEKEERIRGSLLATIPKRRLEVD